MSLSSAQLREAADKLDQLEVLKREFHKTMSPLLKLPMVRSLPLKAEIVKPNLIRPVVTKKVIRRKRIYKDPFSHCRPGNAAEVQIIEEHLPLVRTVTGRVAMSLPPHVDIEDIYSSGLVGLLNATRNYDPQGGSTFNSYARVRIRGAVFDELRRIDWVPRSIHDKARKVQKVLGELEQELGRVPTNEEMARRLKVPLSEYEEILLEIRPATFVCLDSAPCADEEGETSRHESIPDYSQESPLETTSRNELCRITADHLENLPEMQRKVLALYYFEDMRLRQIAECFGLTESRICQIHAAALAKLRDHLAQIES